MYFIGYKLRCIKSTEMADALSHCLDGYRVYASYVSSRRGEENQSCDALCLLFSFYLWKFPINVSFARPITPITFRSLQLERKKALITGGKDFTTPIPPPASIKAPQVLVFVGASLFEIAYFIAFRSKSFNKKSESSAEVKEILIQ